MKLETVIIRLALAIVINREAVRIALVRRGQINEVRKAAVIEAPLDVHWAAGAVDAELDPVALFDFEIGIADEELLASPMRTQGQ